MPEHASSGYYRYLYSDLPCDKRQAPWLNMSVLRSYLLGLIVAHLAWLFFLQPASCYGKGTLTIRSLSNLIRLSLLLLQEWRYPDSDCYCWDLRIC